MNHTKKNKVLVQVGKNLNVRHGAIGQKVGMTSIWHEGIYTPVTLLRISNLIFSKKTIAKDGYNAVVLSYGEPVKITKPKAGILQLISSNKEENTNELTLSNQEFLSNTNQNDLPNEWKDLKYKKIGFSKLKEFRTDLLSDIKIGTKILANYFAINQLINVAATSIGKGFAGGMKRHNFRGLEASHGVSVSHRSIGSTGQNQDPGRTFPGKKMPGHLGSARCTVENLKVLSYYEGYEDILIVKGSIPGFDSCIVEIKDSVRR